MSFCLHILNEPCTIGRPYDAGWQSSLLLNHLSVDPILRSKLYSTQLHDLVVDWDKVDPFYSPQRFRESKTRNIIATPCLMYHQIHLISTWCYSITERNVFVNAHPFSCRLHFLLHICLYAKTARVPASQQASLATSSAVYANPTRSSKSKSGFTFLINCCFLADCTEFLTELSLKNDLRLPKN